MAAAHTHTRKDNKVTERHTQHSKVQNSSLAAACPVCDSTVWDFRRCSAKQRPGVQAAAEAPPAEAAAAEAPAEAAAPVEEAAVEEVCVPHI